MKSDSIMSLGHAPGWYLGALGMPRGSKNYFYEHGQVA